MKKAFWLLVALFLTNFLSMYYGWYITLAWFDIAQHFTGGFLVAMFFVAYLKDRLVPGETTKNTLVIVGSTIFIGVVWEFAEYIANQTLVEPTFRWFGVKAYFMGDLKDTMSDLLMDTLGSILFFMLHSLWGRNSQKIKADPENRSSGMAQS